MTGKQIHATEVALKRAIEAEDDTTAQELAMKLAPRVEVECDALDRDPKAIVPMWGTLA